MRAIAAAEAPVDDFALSRTSASATAPAEIATADMMPSVVQRVIAKETSTIEASESADLSAEGETKEAGQVDVDQLALQVYNQIRRRIAIEWERGRGRW
jgi:methionyl-tRNA formyltransferase